MKKFTFTGEGYVIPRDMEVRLVHKKKKLPEGLFAMHDEQARKKVLQWVKNHRSVLIAEGFCPKYDKGGQRKGSMFDFVGALLLERQLWEKKWFASIEEFVLPSHVDTYAVSMQLLRHCMETRKRLSIKGILASLPTDDENMYEILKDCRFTFEWGNKARTAYEARWEPVSIHKKK